ncbi:MAG: sodium:calcium antiporter [Nevskia sp.]|nr:sodium:calcium antiporter [Nevskia sp.]
MAVALLIVSAGVIYAACEYFVNGVEWVGRKAGIGQTAVGSILAAFGTALPESVVTLVAVAFGASAASKDIGVGAALGGPLVLGTVAYAVVGLATLLTRQQSGPAWRAVNQRRLARDQGWFLFIFLFKIALGLVAFAFKPLLGCAFLAAYALYFWREMLHEEDCGEHELEPLRFQPRRAESGMNWAVAQTVAALVVIFAASHLFVLQLGLIGPWLGLPPSVIALLLSPIATELPETMNAIIWIRQGKQKLALANISGSMMIQATVPSAFGLFFTPWLLDRPLLLAGAITFASVFGLFLLLRREVLSPGRLALFGLLYGVFVAGLILLRQG